MSSLGELRSLAVRRGRGPRIKEKNRDNKAAYLFVAPLSQTARVVEALRQKREAEAPASEAPAAEATTDVAEGGDES